MADDQAIQWVSHDEDEQLLPNRPYLAVNYHYGMLLGVDDFVTDQAYHRGKARLHSAWLHGWGTVWGLAVSADLPSGEIRVEPGLALDGFGRELHVDTRQCLQMGTWFSAHRDDPDLVVDEQPDGFHFDVHVVIRHRVCLMRPVPALLDTCVGSQSETAFSRVFETVELLLKPGRAPASRPRHHLLRLLVGLDEPIEENGTVLPADQAVLDARAALAAAPANQRLALAVKTFHDVSVAAVLADAAGSDPNADDIESTLFPEHGVLDVPLANLNGVVLAPDGQGFKLTAVSVENTVREVLLATSTLQNLLPALLGNLDIGLATGPRVDPASVSRVAAVVTLTVDSALDADTVTTTAFSAAQLVTGTGWQPIAINSAALSADKLTLTVTLAADPATNLLRLMAIGTGSTPLLGANSLPLFGELAAQPMDAGDVVRGRDFVWMNKGN
ncbi:hypothetical protein [Chitinivorax sp. B]|uniref:hypothetical protein n=1 Tax=Chitinivorax sp. B TaxID=2502235 RepID=UPI0010F96573|nr:hypothetical protein [Chitinivorax sp. B]